MASSPQFRPDWASAPGDTIGELLEARGLSVDDFAQALGHTPKDVVDLLQGRATITIGTARQLARILGGSVAFWMSRDFQYREETARLRDADEQWLRELPLGDMIKFGWIKPAPRPEEEMSACLRFFDVPNVQTWRRTYDKVQRLVAFKQSTSFDSRPAAVAAWLRRGQIESQSINCAPWNPAKFTQALAGIRRLTWQKDPGRFIPELKKRCAEVGVAVAIVRVPSGCRASGATYFTSKDKAVLLLSFRYLSDDQFWFTFFHEAGHLLIHGENGFFLEGIDTPNTAEEREASEFAERTLVPQEFQPAMARLPLDGREVIRFARRLGISPGIVVGQLQHSGKITYRQLDSLKRRFEWKD